MKTLLEIESYYLSHQLEMCSLINDLLGDLMGFLYHSSVTASLFDFLLYGDIKVINVIFLNFNF